MTLLITLESSGGGTNLSVALIAKIKKFADGKKFKKAKPMVQTKVFSKEFLESRYNTIKW